MRGTTAQRLPFETGMLGGSLSIVRSTQLKDRPGEPVFNVGLYAPDAQRLGWLYKRFIAHRPGTSATCPLPPVMPLTVWLFLLPRRTARV